MNIDDLGVIAGFVFMIVFMTGWVMNIVKLVTADAFTGMEVARFAGIFIAPLGAVLGWF